MLTYIHAAFEPMKRILTETVAAGPTAPADRERDDLEHAVLALAFEAEDARRFAREAVNVSVNP
jgi:hypothetical protein